MKRSLLSILAIITLLFSSCEKFNPDEPIPAYIYIPNVNVTNENLVGSTNNHDIKDIWITPNGENARPYELPALIPVITNDTQNIIFESGIYKDGMQNAHLVYTFLTPIDTNLGLTPGEIDTFIPDFHYRDNADIEVLLEVDFEDNNNVFEPYADQINNLRIVSGENVIDGNRSGAIFVNSENPTVYIVTSELFEFDVINKLVMLEIEYKSNTYFSIGSTKIDNQGNRTIISRFVTLRPTNGEVKKAYIHLQNNFSGLSGERYQLLFGSIEEEGGVPNGEIFVDNIKLIRE